MRVPSEYPLAGRRAFIFGGTGGLGRETAQALGLAGARVDLHGRSPEKLSRTLAAFRGLGIQAQGSAAPITCLEDASGMAERAAAADILVVAWGPFLQKPLHEMTPEEWGSVTAFNLALPGILASAALSGMRARGWGRILFFGGTRTDGIRGFRSNAAYAAAKTGLGVLVKSIAAEYSRDGIAALVLCPGFAGTEYLTPGQADDLAPKTPLGRLTEPADIGILASDLLSHEPPLWNGSVLTVDEGLFAW